MKRLGFTIVELIITITIMGILLVLAVVNLNGSQASARDTERKTDIETIAQHLETYYNSGTDDSASIGSYPPTADTIMTGILSQQVTLRDIDTKSLVAPGAPDKSSTSLVAASNNLQTAGGITPLPGLANDQNQYIYQPLAIQSDGSWAICDSQAQECRKFNLYYRLETANISATCLDPGYICMITSKNQ